MSRQKIIIVLFCFSILSISWAQAPKQVITILYTADAHGNLYPCDCRKEEDGGMGRRFTLIEQIRKENPNLILIEGGSFFAGSLLDQNRCGYELDKLRSGFYLKCIDLMRYDCLAVGEDEFVFGDEFLLSKMKEAQTPFLSTNISDSGLKPTVIKTVAGLNVAIVSLCPQPRDTALKFFDYKQALNDQLHKLKEEQKINLIILVSRFDDETNKKILCEFKDVNLILTKFDYAKPKTFLKVDQSLIVYPVYEGRQITRIDLFIEGKQLKNFKVRNIRLSEKIKNAFEVAKIIPRCFSDKDCRRLGLVGHCENPGTMSARCVYTEPLDLTVTVIKPEKCYTCQIGQALEALKPFFGGEFRIKFISDCSAESKRLIKIFGIKMLPAYIVSKDIEKSLIFDKIKDNLVLKGGEYLISPSVIGSSYFIGREKVSGKLDLFVLSHDKNNFHIFSLAKQLSENLKDKFEFHFIVFKDEKGKFLSPSGEIEIEEDLRLIAIMKYYPKEFWDYALERAKNVDSTYWDDTAKFFGIDPEKIKSVAQSEEGKKLLGENIKLTQELDIGDSGTLLLNNQEIFGITPETGIKDINGVVESEVSLKGGNS